MYTGITRNLKLVIVAIILATLAGCTTSTAFGQCIGITEKENPNLEYKVSTLNIILGIVFIETIFVPVIVAFDNFKCPYDKTNH